MSSNIRRVCPTCSGYAKHFHQTTFICQRCGLSFIPGDLQEREPERPPTVEEEAARRARDEEG